MARPEARGERSLGLFALGLLVFNPPLLSIFSVEVMLFGLPLLYLYLFAAWAVLIALLALNAGPGARRDRKPAREASGVHPRGGGRA